MAPMTIRERQAMSALKATMTRLKGPQAPVLGPLDRIRLMQRHFDAIDGDLRHGALPAPTHLVALAAHALILWESDDD